MVASRGLELDLALQIERARACKRHAVADHGKLHGYTIEGTYDHSRHVFEQLEALGVHYDDVVRVLEEEGVQKFAASWAELLDTISHEMAAGGSTT